MATAQRRATRRRRPSQAAIGRSPVRRPCAGCRLRRGRRPARSAKAKAGQCPSPSPRPTVSTATSVRLLWAASLVANAALTAFALRLHCVDIQGTSRTSTRVSTVQRPTRCAPSFFSSTLRLPACDPCPCISSLPRRSKRPRCPAPSLVGLAVGSDRSITGRPQSRGGAASAQVGAGSERAGVVQTIRTSAAAGLGAGRNQGLGGDCETPHC
jgi:hypothetical protein